AMSRRGVPPPGPRAGTVVAGARGMGGGAPQWPRWHELSLLVWVATFAITGFVAVLATDTSSFNLTAVVVPVVFLALVLALDVFLVSIRFRGAQILMPIAAGIPKI